MEIKKLTISKLYIVEGKTRNSVVILKDQQEIKKIFELINNATSLKKGKKIQVINDENIEIALVYKGTIIKILENMIIFKEKNKIPLIKIFALNTIKKILNFIKEIFEKYGSTTEEIENNIEEILQKVL